MVRAKFSVISITQSQGQVQKLNDDGSPALDEQGRRIYQPGIVTSLGLAPVYPNGDPNHENSKFWAMSPGGKLELNCVNPAAVAIFEVGKEYYLDFTPAA